MNDWLEYSASGSARNEECLAHASKPNLFSKFGKRTELNDNEKRAKEASIQAAHDAYKKMKEICDIFRGQNMSQLYEFEHALKQMQKASRLAESVASNKDVIGLDTKDYFNDTIEGINMQAKRAINMLKGTPEVQKLEDQKNKFSNPDLKNRAQLALNKLLAPVGKIADIQTELAKLKR